MSELILQAEKISKIYDNASEPVLRDISMSVYESDFISILGASGSGKSTLLSILGGMETATSGNVYFENMNISTMKEKELAKLRRTKIGFVFQFFNLAPYLTVKENILLPLMLDGKQTKKYEDKFNELTENLSISDLIDKLPRFLSGGEQQRVAIARGLIYQPKIIFLDEPTGNLDSKSADEIMVLLKNINSDMHTTILQVTHNETNAAFGNRIIRIKDGQLTEDTCE